MDRYANSYSMRSQEQEEQLYCSGPQNLEDIICEGSDADQTAEEIRKKRRRYEDIGRRYIGGHRPLIQSASLRGPLNPESGWVNPWRSRPRKEAEWWQPGSEDMLFTRENVMRRAADHGLGYLKPSEALAWCKAAAQTEVRNQFDSMDVAHFSGGESDSEDRGEESPRDDHTQTLPDATSKDNLHQVGHDHSTNFPACKSPMADAQADGMRSNGSADSNTRTLKRPAESQWLKGSYVSKRARWEDHPVSSPTPMPDPLSEREQRRRNSSTRSAGSENGQRKPIAQPTTPWSHDAQQLETVSRNTGSTAQEIGSKDSGRNFERQPEDLDQLYEDSWETTFVSAPDFQSVSQGKKKMSQSMDGPVLDIALENYAVTSAKKTSSNAPLERKETSVPRRCPSESNELPVLARSPENRAGKEQVEDDSFITEVAPSSRNLEKFQFRKKRRKSKKHEAKESREGSHEPLPRPRTLPGSGQADTAEQLDHEASVTIDAAQELPLELPEDEPSAGREVSIAIDPAAQLPLDQPEHELNAESEKTPGTFQPRGAALSPEEDSTRILVENNSSGSRRSDESYFKKVAMMSVNVLPNLQFSSPFALFGSFGASKPTPTTTSAIGHKQTLKISEDVEDDLAFDRNEVATTDTTPKPTPTTTPATGHKPALEISEDIDPDLALDQIEEATGDVAPAIPVASGGGHCPIASPKSASKTSRRASTQSSHPAAGDDRSIRPEGQPQAVDASVLDLDILPKGTTPQHAEDTENTAPLQEPVMKSQATPNPKETPLNLTQDTNIYAGTTQSFNTTMPISLRKPRKHAEELHDEMEIILNSFSQDCRGFSSSDRTQSDEDQSSQQSVSAAVTKPEQGRTTPLAPDDENLALSAEEEQDSWQGCGPQSPWAPENLLPAAIASTNQQGEAFVTTSPSLQFSPISHRRISPVHRDHVGDHLSKVREEVDEEKISGDIMHSEDSNQDPTTHTPKGHEGSEKLGSSPPYAQDEGGSDWQHVHRPNTPENDGTTPFRDLISPTLSPQRLESPSDHEEVTDTQQLIEAAIINPWASNSKKRFSRKSKKRVSFGDVLSEEEPELQPEISTFSKQWPGSPPPPQTSDYPRDEDTFNDGITVMSKFGKHFSEATRYKPVYQRNHGLLLNSPTVGAMAERFIAADRETSVEQERHPGLTESPTHHLKPKSDSRTNLSPETTDYDLEVNLDDFLGDAGEFLGDWSVDSEVKKVKDSRGRRDSRREPSRMRDLYGVTSGWS